MGGRVAPMTYRITHFERPDRVVLVGTGSGVDSVDDIRFERSGDGTAIDYTADIRLQGVRRLLQPFLGGTFDGSDATPRQACPPRSPGSPSRRPRWRPGLMRIAIIGAGISGLSAASPFTATTTSRLRRRVADRWPRQDRRGRDGRGPVPVDMGFIVHNDVTYPTFLRMIGELGVETQPGDMSLGIRVSGMWS